MSDSLKRELALLILFATFSMSAAQAGEGSGRVSIEGLQTLTEQPAPVSSTEGRGEIEYNRRFTFGEKFSLRIHPYLYGNTVHQSWERPVTVDPRQLFLEYSHESFYARAGYDTLRFEGTDGVNPMDIASMKDLGDPLASPTRASGGLQLGYSGENTDFQIMYIPRQTESSLAGETSPWWPRRLTLPLRTESTELLLPERVEYKILSRREENEALSNNVTARLQFRSSYGDLAIAGFEGASEIPALHPILTATPVSIGAKSVFLLQSPVQIIPIDFRRRTVAGLISVPVSSWIFRVAARYDQPIGDSKNVPTWSEQSVAGVEKTLEIGSNSVIVIVQGSWSRRPEGSSLLSLQDIFDRAILLGLRYPMGESWSFLASGFSNTKDGSWIAQATVSRRWENGWSVDAGWMGLEGPAGSLLGSFSENDRASLKVTRAF
ncbi:MAG: hypothetical protein V4760_02830 [Bdellovibrionota bacterium]